MSTFLELVQDVARESGTLAGGVTLTTVTGATGRADKIVSWVRKAWVNIQLERRDWLWMRTEFTSTLLADTARYAATSLDIDRLGHWAEDRGCYQPYTLYVPATGVADEGAIRQIPYDTWRYRYGRGEHDANRPTEYAISPQREFCVGATPDQDYTIRGEYQKSAQILTADSDVPEMPADYHSLIVWEAMKLLSASDEAQFSAASSINEYTLVRQRLERDQLPQIVIGFAGGALA